MLKQFPLSQMHLFQISKKGEGGAKIEIPASRIIITLEEDLSPRGKTSSAFIVKKWVTLKGRVDFRKENRRKKIVMLRKMTKRTLQP